MVFTMKNIDYIIIEGRKIDLPVDIGVKMDENGEWKYNGIRCNIYLLYQNAENDEYDEIVHIEKSSQFTFEKYEVQDDAILY